MEAEGDILLHSITFMAFIDQLSSTFSGPSSYLITVEGLLDQNLSSRLAGMSIHPTVSGGHSITTLKGKLSDQAELNGVLNTLYNYRCAVLSVHKV